MTDDTVYVPLTRGENGHPTNPRVLKIEATGDFWRGKVAPKIRISGKWLERAGFKPGHRVQVILQEAGLLTLRFVEKRNEAQG